MSRSKAWITMLVVVFLIFGTIGFFWYQHLKQGMKMLAEFVPPPATVEAVKVKQSAWQPYLQSVGSLEAVNGVDVSAEVAGKVQSILFQSGDYIEKGRPLVQLDDQTEQANLLQYKAKLKLDKLTYERDNALLKKNAISRQDVDSALATLEQTKALVLETEVSISKKLIRAPFSGKAGIRNVNVGQYVSPGDQLVTLQSLNPLHINFSLPQEDINKLSIGQKVSVHIDTYANRNFDGTISAINSKVDLKTRTISVQATLPNPTHSLYPGMFANIYVYLKAKDNVVTVPKTAIDYTLYGDSVYVITLDGKTNKAGEKTGTIKRTLVTTGAERGNTVVINKGLKPGQIVVDGGQMKLSDGAHIAIKAQ